jgi:hypothetical protein
MSHVPPVARGPVPGAPTPSWREQAEEASASVEEKITKRESQWKPSVAGDKLHFPRRPEMSACGQRISSRERQVSGGKCLSCIRYWNTNNPGDQIEG